VKSLFIAFILAAGIAFGAEPTPAKKILVPATITGSDSAVVLIGTKYAGVQSYRVHVTIRYDGNRLAFYPLDQTHTIREGTPESYAWGAITIDPRYGKILGLDVSYSTDYPPSKHSTVTTVVE
jgi:hypothetical protein